MRKYTSQLYLLHLMKYRQNKFIILKNIISIAKFFGSL